MLALILLLFSPIQAQTIKEWRDSAGERLSAELFLSEYLEKQRFTQIFYFGEQHIDKVAIDIRTKAILSIASRFANPVCYVMEIPKNHQPVLDILTQGRGSPASQEKARAKNQAIVKKIEQDIGQTRETNDLAPFPWEFLRDFFNVATFAHAGFRLYAADQELTKENVPLRLAAAAAPLSQRDFRYRHLYEERNQAMAKVVKKLSTTCGTILFPVGAGHLTTKESFSTFEVRPIQEQVGLPARLIQFRECYLGQVMLNCQESDKAKNPLFDLNMLLYTTRRPI